MAGRAAKGYVIGTPSRRRPPALCRLTKDNVRIDLSPHRLRCSVHVLFRARMTENFNQDPEKNLLWHG
jgi:hypothetical protein